jgi:hypothetical protein
MWCCVNGRLTYRHAKQPASQKAGFQHLKINEALKQVLGGCILARPR